MGNKILVIGLDGFETTLADPLMRDGRMPNLKRLLETSARVELDHGTAKRSGLAWEHFSTGMTPTSANRWSAVTFDPETYRCTQEPTRLAPFPSGLKCKTVVFDAPYFSMDRARNVKGIVSWGAHDPGTPHISNPRSLTQEIQARFGEYPARPWIYGFTWPSVERTQAMGEGLVQATKVRAEITRWLFGERLPDWDLGIVVVSELHSAIEALWHGVDSSHPLHHLPSGPPAKMALEAVYEAVDALIGDLVNGFPECAHLLFSMHGMGPNTADVPAMALLPEYLYRRAFGAELLVGAVPDAIADLRAHAESSWSTHVRQHWVEQPPTPTSPLGPVSLAKAAMKAIPLTRRLGNFVTKQMRKRVTASQTDTVPWMPASWYAPYWPKMQAFALPAFYDGQIRINLKGRERLGQVPIDAYDTICTDIASELSQCIDPETGRPAVEQIVFTHPGDPMAVSATEADLIVVWQGSPMSLSWSDSCRIGPVAPRRPGGHTGGNGVSLWHGDHFAPGYFHERSAFDVVPSLIEYLTGTGTETVDGESFISMIRR